MTDAAAAAEETTRVQRYRTVSEQKKLQVLPAPLRPVYYAELLELSQRRDDPRAHSDKKQIKKDLSRTFAFLPPARGPGGEEALVKLLENLLLAYVERGRALTATASGPRPVLVVIDPTKSGSCTTPRGLLDGYSQGLNFFAGMSLLCAGGACWDGSGQPGLEETAFWLLALLLEDVLDPDFFGADVKGNMQMAFVGGLGMKNMVVDLAESRCPSMFEALGHEAFVCSLGSVLDKWVLSLFIGCAPHRLIQHLWDHLILPSPYHDDTQKLPRGLGTLVAFSLAGLVCCGEEQLQGTPILEHLRKQRLKGACAEDLSLEAAEAIQKLHVSLSKWPAERDGDFLNVCTTIMVDLARTGCDSSQLWEEVRKQKQRIVDVSDNVDQQMMSLAKRTHFTVTEIGRLRSELENFQARRRADSFGPLGTSKSVGRRNGRDRAPSSSSSFSDEGLSLDAFTELVRRAVPKFPPQLCERLFQKLDVFGVGHLAFAELACGMSALSLGTMDEKLQVCFDLFDSEGQRALKLKDLCELCTVLFRVALTQGFEAAKVPSTDDVLSSLRGSRVKSEPPQMRAAYTVDSAVGSPRGQARRRMTLHGEVSVGRRISQLISPGPSRDGSPTPRIGGEQQPWRSMLLRLLSVAQVRTPGGPWLVAFEDFRTAAHMEPALLCLFSWLPPRPPDMDGPTFEITPEERISSSCAETLWLIVERLKGCFRRG